jgi:hypothetical protein
MTNEQLLMLDSLVYFSKFSNNFTPKSDGTFYSVGDFVNAALANPNDYETCFNGALGYNDGDLGMYDILDDYKRVWQGTEDGTLKKELNDIRERMQEVRDNELYG